MIPSGGSRRGRRALTIIEVVISMLVVSSMLVAALSAVGASRLTLARASDTATAVQLADDLLGYVYRLPYESAGSVLGLELDDILGDKTTYDDVDDFDNFKEEPPRFADGSAMSGMTGWSRSVRVQWINGDGASVAGVETGIKRITVTVHKNGAMLARRAALRTNLTAASE